MLFDFYYIGIAKYKSDGSQSSSEDELKIAVALSSPFFSEVKIQRQMNFLFCQNQLSVGS